MVACPKCVVNNTLDSAFCKKCGAVLPIAVIEEEQEKLREIVTKGMESYQTGNLEEALAISEHAILTNPSYGEAYALKGLVHERKGEYAEALDSYETVVALNPDSTIDKIKLNQLRNAFAQRQAGEPKTDRKGAVLMGLAATLLFASVGGIVYGVMQNTHEDKQVQSGNMPLQPKTSPQNDGKTNPTPVNQPAIDPNKPNPGNHDDVGALGADNNPPTDSGPRLTSRNNGSRYNGPTYFEGGVEPAPVSGPVGRDLPNPNKGPNPTSNPQKNPTKEPEDPKPGPNGGGDDPVVAAKDTGTIEVSLSKGPGTTNGTNRGGTIENSTTPSNTGAGSGKSFQRQGQTFARTGKSSQAREAYEKAIDAYEKEISSGKGDKEAAQAGLNSCRQALKNLKD